MMKFILTISFLILSNPFSCDEENRKKYEIAAVPVVNVTIQDTVFFPNPIEYEVTCTTPNPCWLYGRTELNQMGNLLTIKIFAKYDGQVCIQILGSINVAGKIFPKERGPHYLKFWQSETQTLDRTIIVL